MSYDESLEDYEQFLNIMFNNWTQDEMAYMHHKVRHPSYSKDVEESS